MADRGTVSGRPAPGSDSRTAAERLGLKLPRRSLPQQDHPVHRDVLDNGLRVLVAPQSGTGVVGVAVHYDVGMRSEPKGRTGFAHLFEHLMFQGSESLPKLEHFRTVQSSGGSFNGSTHFDYTEYHEVMPAAALERGLFLEADRMRAPAITAENLANQVDVVSEEIRLNVLNRPYGGFPWILLPPVLFDTFANAHNGYGDFVDLRAATVADAAGFFETYYSPANAVLTICGDIDAGMALDLAGSHFSDVPARPAPQRPSFAEPAPVGTRRAIHHDPLAPAPAVAIGWRLPDPVDRLDDYLAYVMLGEILTVGESGRLQQAVVDTGLATDIWAGPGLLGGPLDSRDPDVFGLSAIHPLHVPVDDVIGATDQVLSRLAAEGPAPEELRRAAIRFATSVFRENDSVTGRTLNLGSSELLHARAELIDELPALVAGVTAEQVAAAAASLDHHRAELQLVGRGAAQGRTDGGHS